MRLSTLAWLVLVGCSAPAYVTVSVVSDAGGVIAQLQLTASDGLKSLTTDAPTSPSTGGLIFPASYVISAPPGAPYVRADVQGYSANGVLLAQGTTQVAPLATGGFPQNLTVTLTPFCQLSRDCEPNATCAGAVACVYVDDAGADGGSGRCVALDGGEAPLDGSGCGPLGYCDAGACVGPTCGDGTLQPDAGEQCDNGGLNSDTQPFACRTNCQLYHCGDGVLDQGPSPDGGVVGERCDLGVANGLGQGCNATCTLTGTTSLLAGFPDQPGWYNGPTFDNGGGALFNRPFGLAFVAPRLYVADTSNSAIRDVNLDAGYVYTRAGEPRAIPGTFDGFDLDAGFYLPAALVTPAPDVMLIGQGGSVRQLNLETLEVTTLAGLLCSGLTLSSCAGNASGSFDAGPGEVSFGALTGFALDPSSGILYATQGSPFGLPAIRELSLPSWTATTLFVDGGPQSPSGIALLDGGLFVLDQSSNVLWAIDPASGNAVPVTPVPLPGLAFAGFNGAQGLCTDGTSLFIPDTGNSTIWQLEPSTGSLSLVAGAGKNSTVTTTYGVGTRALFEGPLGCTFDPGAGTLYVSDGKAAAIFQIQ